MSDVKKSLYLSSYFQCRMSIYKIEKEINPIIAGASFLTSIITHKPFIAGMPLAAGIEITNHCNLKCPECSSGSDILTRTRGFYDREAV